MFVGSSVQSVDHRGCPGRCHPYHIILHRIQPSNPSVYPSPRSRVNNSARPWLALQPGFATRIDPMLLPTRFSVSLADRGRSSTGLHSVWLLSFPQWVRGPVRLGTGWSLAQPVSLMAIIVPCLSTVPLHWSPRPDTVRLGFSPVLAKLQKGPLSRLRFFFRSFLHPFPTRFESSRFLANYSSHGASKRYSHRPDHFICKR